ncbi:class I SAM-dependent methyltransferase [Mycobacterium sp.]|uniref:class I SAM-dependent methyltransferase n=1 Tax=Mycobacterium sp. TaxID=1785 RepID=UPI003D6A431D
MASRHTMFRVFYRVGFTPWDGHPIVTPLRELIEGADALPPASALDVGCGTGGSSIYLAQHGWQVTGVDFVPKALDKARAKARAADATVNFIHADVTHLSQAGISGPFELIVDNGCLHGMSAHDRDLYLREITAAAAPGARLSIVAFKPGGGVGPVGISQAEIERRFAPAWALLSAADETVTPQGKLTGRFGSRFQARSYVFQRQ